MRPPFESSRLLDGIAEHLDARRIGPGRFIAKCPAHSDRSPSLAISAGRDGRVLLSCFAGCDTSAVVAAAGLAFADLFAGPPPTAAQLAATNQERTKVDLRRQESGAEERAWCSALREGFSERDCAVRRVGHKVALLPANDTGAEVLSSYFHDLIAECRSFDRAIIGDADDWFALEKAAPPKPWRKWDRR